MRVGYLASSFDLLHVGHLDVINQAREHCEVLVVGVFDDELVARLTGRRPVVPFDERLALMGHVRGVSRALVHSDDRPAELEAGPVFVIAGDEPAGLVDALPLISRRQTSSPTLLAALAPAQDQAVA